MIRVTKKMMTMMQMMNKMTTMLVVDFLTFKVLVLQQDQLMRVHHLQVINVTENG